MMIVNVRDNFKVSEEERSGSCVKETETGLSDRASKCW